MKRGYLKTPLDFYVCAFAVMAMMFAVPSCTRSNDEGTSKPVPKGTYLFKAEAVSKDGSIDESNTGRASY